MKRAVLTAALLTAIAAGLGGCASDQGYAGGTTSQAQAGDKGATYMTGSLIPQNVNRYGRITDSSSNVRVLDQKTIQGSGQQNVQDLLNQQGVTH